MGIFVKYTSFINHIIPNFKNQVKKALRGHITHRHILKAPRRHIHAKHRKVSPHRSDDAGIQSLQVLRPKLLQHILIGEDRSPAVIGGGRHLHPSRAAGPGLKDQTWR